MKLTRQLNTFIKHYNTSGLELEMVTKDNMYDHNTLMSIKEALWLTLDNIDINDKTARRLFALYGDLSDRIDDNKTTAEKLYRYMTAAGCYVSGLLCGIHYSAVMIYGWNTFLKITFIITLIATAICAYFAHKTDI